MNYLELEKILYDNTNIENIIPMEKYMKNNFEFLGIKSKERKDLSKPFINYLSKSSYIHWDFIEYFYKKDEREFQYIAINYLVKVRKLIEFKDIKKIKNLIKEKSWWDSTDSIVKSLYLLPNKDNKFNETMLDWSTDENLWVKRTAIIHQLHKKSDTNKDLLEKIIVNNFNSKEFFINKAIGWALRDYSKTNPKWVINFLNKYNSQLNSLSIREASKYI